MQLYPTWLRERVYFDGDSYFDELIRAIDEARHSVDLETYIFYPDEMGRWLEARLEAAALRGVQVRLLVDGIGALAWIGSWSKTLRAAGVQVRIWNPVYVGPFLVAFLRTFIRRRNFARFFSHLNRRTHRKYCVIDKRLAFVGSQNISRQHLDRFSGGQAWRDTGVEVEGPPVKKILRAFDHVWDRSYTPEGRRRYFGRRKLPRLSPKSLVRLNFTRGNRRRFWRDLLDRLRSARARVWVTNPYFVPTRSLMESLMQARRGGADVRMLVPARSDVFFMRWVATSYYGALIKSGVRVFEYVPRILHAKSMIIDDWAIAGTSNMNTRSFLHDLEIDIVLTKDETKALLVKQFERDLQNAREITAEGWRGRVWTSGIGRVLAFFLRNWL